MAKVKNKRENHTTKRGTYGYGYGPKETEKGSRGGRGEKQARSGREGFAERENRGRAFSPQERKDRGMEFSPARRKPAQAEADFEQPSVNVIVGRNPVTEALKSGREIDKLLVSATEGSMIKILAQAKEKGIPVMRLEKAALDRLAQGQAHQGVAAYVSPYAYSELEDIFALAEARGEDPLILILDNLEDPHNLGAIIRTAECAGVHGIIIPKRRSAGLSYTVAKASAGAIEYMRVARVTNIAVTLDELKEKGVWVYGADMDGTDYDECDFSGACAIVIGNEGKGISRLVREKCDVIASLPMKGQINSLNASVAAGILMYKAMKNR